MGNIIDNTSKITILIPKILTMIINILLMVIKFEAQNFFNMGGWNLSNKMTKLD